MSTQICISLELEILTNSGNKLGSLHIVSFSGEDKEEVIAAVNKEAEVRNSSSYKERKDIKLIKESLLEFYSLNTKFKYVCVPKEDFNY